MCRMRYCAIGLIFLYLLSCQIILPVSEAQENSRVLWQDVSPDPYVNSDVLLVKDSYQEKWGPALLSAHGDAVARAREIIEQWGLDLEKGSPGVSSEKQDKLRKFNTYVSESEHFISIVFVPLTTGKGVGISIEVRMRKKDFTVVSILPGS
ncbi:MAG: hypothetical protein ABIC68_07650 [Candidatus Omnitrophota bacterium]